MNYTFKQFQAEYPNDDVCLDKLFLQRFGKTSTCPDCGVVNSKFHRITGRRAYACQWCGYHLYPCSNTPFEKSTTPLTDWFYAIYQMTVTRNGISAKELQRVLGVTYKTAWRMLHKLREMMSRYVTAECGLGGHVEVDETYIGGKEKNKHANKRTKGTQGFGSIKTKTVVMGFLSRNGNVYAEVVPDTNKETLHQLINFEVAQGKTLSTDELPAYQSLASLGYEHGVVRHGIGEYVNGKHHTNSIEGFWRHLKCGLVGTYVRVSPKYLDYYVDEFSFRYNLRNQPHTMFEKLISTIRYFSTKRTQQYWRDYMEQLRLKSAG